MYGFSRREIYLLLVLAPLSGCTGKSKAVTESSADEKKRVVVISPDRKTLPRTTTQPATVHPFYQAEVHARIAGYLKALKVDIGAPVKINQILGIIDVPEMDKSRERQVLVIARLQAEEKKARAGMKLAEANLQASMSLSAQAKAEESKAAAQLKAHLAELQRIQLMVKSKSVVASMLDEAQEQYESSEAGKLAAKFALQSAEANVKVARASVSSAEADLKIAEAATAVAQKRLEELDELMAYGTLRAPFDGVVIERNVDPGDLVRNIQSTGDDKKMPLFIIAQLDKVRVRVAVPENHAPWADPGDDATVTFRAMPGQELSGKVARVAKGLDASTRTMQLEIDLPNPKQTLLPGMYGEAKIILEKGEKTLMLPAGAVRYDEKGQSFVYAVDADDQVKVIPVTTGQDDGNRIEITDGLTGKERIVNASIGRLQPGQKVLVK